MHYLSFTSDGRASYGILGGSEVVDLGTPERPTLRSRIEAGPLGTEDPKTLKKARRFPIDRIRFLPPIANPDKIICAGLNYRTHASETHQPIPEHPSLFTRFPGSQVGHREPTVCPDVSTSYDFEAELAVIIGKSARHVPESNALNIVAGYSCFAENSVRDWQHHAPQITPGKNFDQSGAFGPALATPDEIAELGQVEVIGRLNNIEVQRDRIAGLIFDIPYLISYISKFARLVPGDVIVTGTPAGVGFTRKPPLFMKPGDVFEVEVTGVGTLTNPIKAEERR